MLTRMQQRRGTQAEWNDSVIASTVILQAGELGLETDTGRFKIGNGTSVWQDLPYYLPDNNPASVAARIGKNNQDIYARLSPFAPTNSQDFIGTQVMKPNASNKIPLVVSGISGQTAVLQRWRNIADDTLASIDQNGVLFAKGGANFQGNVDVNNNKITSLGAPVVDSDAVNKGYVDQAIAGLAWKEAVQLIAHGPGSNVALTGATNTLNIDTYGALNSTDNGYRILLSSQTTATENGIYVYNDNGTTYTLTRATDADTPAELVGASVYVQEGTRYGQTSWVQSNHYIDSFDDQTWAEFSGAALITAGNGLVKDGNTIDVVGTADRITANADSIDIASTYVGQTTITTLGTVTTGTWGPDATTIAATSGGTGQESYAVGDILYADTTTSLNKLGPGTTGYPILSNGTGNAPSYGQVNTAGIADDAVTYDKLQNISAQYHLLGRISAGAGNAQEVGPDSLIAFINQANAGGDNISFNLLPVGTTSTTVAQGDHTHSLDQLSDVVISGTPVLRQVLKYDGSNWINELPSGGISVGDTPPGDASEGDAWFDSTDGSLYVYYDDGASDPTFAANGTDTESVSHGSGYIGELTLTWTRDEPNNRYVVNYLYVIKSNAFSSFFGAVLVGGLQINGNTVWAPSGTYTISTNSTLTLASGSINLAYAPGSDLSLTGVGTLSSSNIGTFSPGVVTVSGGTLADFPGGASAQWVQVKANSALEASILTRLSAVEARSTEIEAANAVRVANQAERDSVYPAPVQGNTVFRADLGYEEKYYAAYNATTNPDGTKGTPGWYEYRGGAPLSENYLINGALDIWQRGTSGPGFVSSGGFVADRWQGARESAVAGQTMSRQSSGLTGIQYCLRLQRDSGNTGTQALRLSQSIESANSFALAGKTVTLSFYARTGANFSGSSIAAYIYSGTGTDQNNLISGFTGNSTVASSLSLPVSSSWTRFTISGSVSSSATQLAVMIAYTPSGTAGAADYIEITGVQLEEGPVPTDFRRNQPNIQAELAACQRYYYDPLFGITTANAAFSQAFAYNATQVRFSIKSPVSMRAVPTLVGTTASSFWFGYNAISNYQLSAITLETFSTTDLFTFMGTASGMTANNHGFMYRPATSGIFGISAEL